MLYRRFKEVLGKMAARGLAPSAAPSPDVRAAPDPSQGSVPGVASEAKEGIDHTSCEEKDPVEPSVRDASAGPLHQPAPAAPPQAPAAPASTVGLQDAAETYAEAKDRAVAYAAAKRVLMRHVPGWVGNGRVGDHFS
jgi:hypothetical protein